MSSPRRPEVFVSATSADLRTCRQLIKEALLTLGCVPVEQTNFPPDYRTVRDMLRTKIAACDAVVHLAGVVYGAEPTERAPGEPRRSYTQMEYDLARELKKPLYTFVCGEAFAYDEHTPEDDDKRALQQAHRDALSSGDNLYHGVRSRDDLALRVRELQTHVEALGAELQQTRSWLGRGVMIGLAALLLLGGGLWWLTQRTGKTETKVAQLETELDKHRRYLKSVADAFTEMQSQLRELKLTDDQIFDRAITNVAKKENLSEIDLRAGIDLFVAATKHDAAASDYDRALADFAQKSFASAAEHAGRAAHAARARRLANEKLATQLALQADEARRQEREAFTLQGQAAYAAKSYEQATQAFESALEATAKDEIHNWSALQLNLANALSGWAQDSGAVRAQALRARALDAFAAANTFFQSDPAIAPLIAYNSALVHLGSGIAANDPSQRQRHLSLAEATFRRLEQQNDLFLHHYRELIITHRCITLYFRARDESTDTRISTYRLIGDIHQAEIKRQHLLQMPSRRLSSLDEIHAAALIAMAALSSESAIRENNFLSARELLKDALAGSRDDNPARRAALKNNLALAQIEIAKSQFDFIGELVDPDTGEVVREVGRIAPAQSAVSWEAAFAGFADSLAGFESQSLGFESACVKANWGAALREFSQTQVPQARTLALERSVQLLREAIMQLGHTPPGEQAHRWLVASLQTSAGERPASEQADIRQEIDQLSAKPSPASETSPLSDGIFIWRFESLSDVDWLYKKRS